MGSGKGFDLKMQITKIIRVLTMPPIVAAVALSILLGTRPDIFGSVCNYFIAFFFLTVIPLPAYPLQPVLPYFKEKGRDGQRQLAIWMSVAGYIAGILTATACHVPKGLKQIYFVYLISGFLILLFNKGIKIKASGHASGVVGAMAYLFHFVGWPAFAGLIVLAATYWASLGMKRHKLSELILGSVIPIIVACIVFL